jgi:hypothetical protein
MMTTRPLIALHDPAYQEHLADGYILRWATEADQASIDDLYARVFGDEHESGRNEKVATFARRVVSGTHPLGIPGDIAIVTDSNNIVVAATLLMRMPIEYAGIAVQSGRPEIVASDERVRNRGFVRKIFAMIHARSEQRGDLVQGITGIPYYYRQFGYEYALTLGGGHAMSFQSIPALDEGQTEPFAIRKATNDDIMTLLMLYERERTRPHNNLPMLVSSKIDAAYFRYAIAETDAHEPWVPYVITRPDGDVVGSFWVSRIRPSNVLGCWSLITEPHVRMSEVFASLTRGLRDIAATMPTWDSRTKPADTLYFGLGVDHPVYPLITQRLHRWQRPYGWYIRVPDLPKLLGQIAPAIERRLAQSAYAGYTGELNIDFYRSGLKIVATNGKLRFADWRKGADEKKADAGYPPLVMLQQIFGMRSIYELKESHPDTWSSLEAEPLLHVLFPKQSSWLAPLD